MKYLIRLFSMLYLVLLFSLPVHAENQRIVRVGAFNLYPGIFKDTDGAVKGFYVDALADIAKRENIRFEYVYGSWNEGLERIKSGEVDVLTSVAFTPERALFLDYAATPLLTVWGELYVPLASEIDGIRAVEGKQIAVMKGDFNARHFIELVKKFDISCEFVEMAGFDDVFKAVAAKRVDAGVVNSIFGVAKQKEYGLRSTGIVFNPFDIFFAVAKGENGALLKLLDTYLNNWRHQADSPFNMARQKWSHPGSSEIHVIPHWLRTSAAILTALSLCALAFIFVLKRQVLNKTRDVVKSAEQYKILSDRQNAILAAVPDIIMEVDANRVYTWSNSAGLEFFGNDVIGREASYYFVGKQNTYDIIQPLFKGEKDIIYVESWQRRKDGESRLLAWWCKTLTNEQDDVTGTLSTARDITDVRRVEDDKVALYERFKAIMDSLDALVYVADMDTYELLFINEYGKKLFGDIEGKICWQVLQSDQVKPCDFCTNKYLILPDNQPAEAYVWEVQNTVTRHWFQCRDKAIRWHDNRLVRMEIATDITEAKQAEESLRLTRLSIEHASDALFWITPEACFTDVNEAACHSLGYSREELLQLTVQDVDTYFDVNKWPEHFAELRRCKSLKFESEQRAKDGRLIPVEIVANYVQGSTHELNCAFVRDISDRKRVEAEKNELESQLHQAQKIESVGRLAGGVAHDFNNLLTVILGRTELALMKVNPSHPLYANLMEIQAAAERSADLTRQLLAFARKQTIAPKILDLNETVAGMLKMLQRLIGESIQLTWQPKANLWPIKMDPSQIDQILANLCVNAHDAINDIGKIRIETDSRTVDEHYCAVNAGFIPGEYVLLSVSDDGCGMDKETQAHIFEPFFTTKGLGEGTGLGLSTVYGIVKQNQGFINVYSELGQGTTFTIFLPRYEGSVDHIQDHTSDKLVPRGKETVLLVEDEPSILDMATTMLEELGYTVLSSNSPTSAIRLAQEHTSHIDLLITDVVMPEMTGLGLAENLSSFSKDMKLLFMSGYTADIIAKHGVLDDGVNFIQKPFSLAAIAIKVREVLDGTS